MSDDTVLRVPRPAEIRDELLGLVLKDLHGPLAGENEEFTERPTDRYILGRLAPDGAGGDHGEDDRVRNTPNMVSLAPSPFAGDTETATWPAARTFRPGQPCSPLQAAFAAAYHLPEVAAVAVGADQPTHLAELVTAARLDIDRRRVATYRTLLTEREAAMVAVT